jgi:hypothetical protein
MITVPELVNDVSWPAFVLDAAGCVTEWNAQMAHLSTLTRAAAISQQFTDLISRFADDNSLGDWLNASNQAYCGTTVHQCDLSIKTHGADSPRDGPKVLTCCLTPSFTDCSRKQISHVVVIGFLTSADRRPSELPFEVRRALPPR